jgi:hypothetical protein
MITVPKKLAAGVLALTAMSPVAGQQRPIPAALPAPTPPYPVYADLVLAAPVIVEAAIHSTTRIKGPEAAGVPPGQVRLYVEADVLALIRGAEALPPRIRHDIEQVADSRRQCRRESATCSMSCLIRAADCRI